MIQIKRGDLVPAYTATLQQNGTPIDLTTATEVTFAMRDRSTRVLKVDAAASIISAAAGTVSYQWVAADVDTEGIYDAEWQIAWLAGKQTIPSDGFDLINILGDIAAATIADVIWDGGTP